MKYKIDQIALLVEDAEAHKKELERVFGLENWVEDDVEADVWLYEVLADVGLLAWRRKAGTVKYRLKFNYGLFDKELEYELIEISEGLSYHQYLKPPCISHFGCHVVNLVEAVEYFRCLGYRPIQMAETKKHTGTERRYEYMFVDTRKLLGYYLKLIRKI